MFRLQMTGIQQHFIIIKYKMDNRHRGRDKDYDRFDRIGDRGFGFGMGSMMGSMGGMKRGSSEKFTAKIRVYEKFTKITNDDF